MAEVAFWGAALFAAALCFLVLGRTEIAPWTAFEPTIMVVPPEVPNPTLDRGCWIRQFDGPGFSGQSFVFVGPAELRALDLAAIRRFRRRVASAETGPRAKATLYSQEGFAGSAVNLEPSTEKATLQRRLDVRGATWPHCDFYALPAEQLR